MAAYAGIYVLTEAEIQSKEGANIAAAVTSDMHTQWVNEAGDYLNVICRHVFAVDAAAFALLPASKRFLLSEACSNLAAIYGIAYDMSGWARRAEAVDKINILWARWEKCANALRDQSGTTYMKKV